MQKFLSDLKSGLKDPFVKKLIFLYIVTAALVMLIFPHTFDLYFVQQWRVFDAGHYHRIGTGGYSYVNSWAFYPLWPTITGLFFKIFPQNGGIAINIFGLIIFFLSIPFVYQIFKTFFSEFTAKAMLFCFVLNPNAIFHALAYTESLAIVFIIGIFFCILNLKSDSSKNKNTQIYIWGFLWSLLLSLQRASTIQLILSLGLSCLFLMILLRKTVDDSKGIPFYIFSIFVSLGSMVGYSIYGIYCLVKTGNFFHPFDVQKYWGKKTGLYWELITNPDSHSGSDHLLTWDIQAFYLPSIMILLLGFILFRSVYKGNKDLAKYFLLCTSIGWCFSHTAIQFFSFPRFWSLARFNFTYPMIFLALGFFIDPYVKNKWVKRFIYFYCFFSWAYYANHWLRYSRESWLG